MSIICNFDDIYPSIAVVPASSAASQVYDTTKGMFGNGTGSTGQAWTFLRIGDGFVYDGSKRTIVANCRITNRGSSPINIMGAGFAIGGGNIDTTIVAAGLLDGRDSAGSPSSAAMQIRTVTLNSGGLSAYTYSPSGSPLTVGRWMRIETTIQASATAGNIDITVNFYIHGTNQLYGTLTATRAFETGQTVWPMVVNYGPVSIDNVQMMVGDEPYVSNFPMKVYANSAFARRPVKVRKGSEWVAAFPKSYKNSQWNW